jgi:hypothetical protein
MSNPDLQLVLAGNLDPTNPPPTEGVCHLGRLQHSQMNDFYNAMDINCISMLDTEFGRYAFPQKAYEMLAAGRPVVLPLLESMANIKGISVLRYPCKDIEQIKSAILKASKTPEASSVIPSWSDQIDKIEGMLKTILD